MYPIPSPLCRQGMPSHFATCGAAVSLGQLRSKTQRLGKSVCRRLLKRSAALSTTQRRPHHFPAGAEAVTFVVRPFPLGMHRNSSRGFSVGVSHSVRRFRSSCHTLLTLITSPFPHYSIWEAAEHEGSYVFCLFHLLIYALKSTHIVADTIRPTCPTSAPLFPQYGLTAFRRTAPRRLVALCMKVGAPAWTLEQVGLLSRVLPYKDVLCATGDGRYSRKTLR